MSLIKASLTAGVRPTTMILGEDNRKPWTDLDVLIMHAYQITEDERCSQCGLPRWMCHSADPTLQVRIKEDHCFVKEEIDKKSEAVKDKDAKKGVVHLPEMYSTQDRPLHTYRTPYYEHLAAERAEEED